MHHEINRYDGQAGQQLDFAARPALSSVLLDASQQAPRASKPVAAQLIKRVVSSQSIAALRISHITAIYKVLQQTRDEKRKTPGPPRAQNHV